MTNKDTNTKEIMGELKIILNRSGTPEGALDEQVRIVMELAQDVQARSNGKPKSDIEKQGKLPLKSVGK